jgi:hypothetical protein
MLNQIVADSGTATESRTLRFGITCIVATKSIEPRKAGMLRDRRR